MSTPCSSCCAKITSISRQPIPTPPRTSSPSSPLATPSLKDAGSPALICPMRSPPVFSEVTRRLLEGAFICNTAYPDLFTYLTDEATRREVDGFLGRMGLRLAATPHGEAFYAAHARLGSAERADIRSLFREIKYEVRPVLAFLNLVMQATHADTSLCAGDTISFPALLHSVSDNAHLDELLRTFASLGAEFGAADANSRSILDKVLQRLARAGYLVADRERDRYQVTGKIDYFYEVLDFLAENEADIQDTTDSDPEPETGQLL